MGLLSHCAHDPQVVFLRFGGTDFQAVAGVHALLIQVNLQGIGGVPAYPCAGADRDGVLVQPEPDHRSRRRRSSGRRWRRVGGRGGGSGGRCIGRRRRRVGGGRCIGWRRRTNLIEWNEGRRLSGPPAPSLDVTGMDGIAAGANLGVDPGPVHEMPIGPVVRIGTRQTILDQAAFVLDLADRRALAGVVGSDDVQA